MIRQDNISLALTLIICMIAFFMFTYEKSSILLLPLALTGVGIAFNWLFGKKIVVDEEIDEEEASNIGKYSFIGLLGAGLGALVSRSLFMPTRLIALAALQLTPYDSLIFALLMAVAEEQFFRGFFLNFALWKLYNQPYGISLALLLSGLVFAYPYHQNIYGTSTQLLFYVFIGGFVFSWIDLKTKRLSPSMISHLAVNFLGGIG